MTSIRSFSEILKSQLSDRQDKSADFVDIIHNESLRLTKLLDEILDISYLESGKPVLHPETVSVLSVLERARTAASSVIADRGADIILPAEDIQITTDPDRLVQPVINLIVNAVKHNPDHSPKVWIELSTEAETDRDKKRLILTITDNGPGIPHVDQIDIFQKFATSASGNSSGVGLGLPISAQIIRLLGGEIKAENIETGSRFTITLPLILS